MLVHTETQTSKPAVGTLMYYRKSNIPTTVQLLSTSMGMPSTNSNPHQPLQSTPLRHGSMSMYDGSGAPVATGKPP
jgi:hypothetical protein